MIHTLRPTLVYVSGPLTTGVLTHNVRAALDVGRYLRERGYAVIVPHENILSDITCPQSYESWLDYDLGMILCCDALYRVPGPSAGADREVAFAEENSIPVYFAVKGLLHDEPVYRRRVREYSQVSFRSLSETLYEGSEKSGESASPILLSPLRQG